MYSRTKTALKSIPGFGFTKVLACRLRKHFAWPVLMPHIDFTLWTRSMGSSWPCPIQWERRGWASLVEDISPWFCVSSHLPTLTFPPPHLPSPSPSLPLTFPPLTFPPPHLPSPSPSLPLPFPPPHLPILTGIPSPHLPTPSPSHPSPPSLHLPILTGLPSPHLPTPHLPILTFPPSPSLPSPFHPTPSHPHLPILTFPPLTFPPLTHLPVH